ncbi:hypothetical protein WJ969_13820 [Achromobacter xylosoxidans]
MVTIEPGKTYKLQGPKGKPPVEVTVTAVKPRAGAATASSTWSARRS